MQLSQRPGQRSVDGGDFFGGKFFSQTSGSALTGFLNCRFVNALEGDSHVEWFEGNFQDYEKDKMRRLGQDSIIPHRMKYKKLTR